MKLTIILLIAFFLSGSGYKQYTATAYALKGRMANGRYVHKGAIAADPRILPLGTKVHIKNMGTYTVTDTGSAIKGRRIDIWMPSKRQAIKFGRRKVHLKVLK